MNATVEARKSAVVGRLAKGDIIIDDDGYFEVTTYPVRAAEAGRVEVRLKRVNGTNRTRSRAYTYPAGRRFKLVK